MNSRYTWSNRHIWPWRAKWSRAKANWILPIECTSHRKYPFSTIQEMTLHMDITKWSIAKSNWWRSCIQSAKTRPGADFGSDHQLLTAKLRLKLKKTGKKNRPAKYNLSQILYEFIVEVMNRFKGLDLVNSVPEELWTEVVILYRRWQTKSPQTTSKARRQSGYLWRFYK